MPSEDKMQRKTDGTYTVTVANLTLDEAIALLRDRPAANTDANKAKDAEVHYRG